MAEVKKERIIESVTLIIFGLGMTLLVYFAILIDAIKRSSCGCP
jgi:hypothetical protein